MCNANSKSTSPNANAATTSETAGDTEHEPLTDRTRGRDDEDPPRRLHAIASAQHLTMAIDVTLHASGSATELHSLFNVKGEGPLTRVVDGLFERRATERTAQFAEALEKRFGRSSAA